jgi:hypothetical protein
VHWNVSASPVNYETATFTVNHGTAQEQLGAFDPLNVTHEFGVKLGFHFAVFADMSAAFSLKQADAP